MLDREFVHKLDRLQLIVPRPTSLREGQVRARSSPAPQGFEVHGFRPYAWGEDLRHLDWNAYARTGELLVRVFRAERESAAYLLLDTSASMAVAHADNSVHNFACRLAAALAYVCLRRNEPVALAALAASPPHCRISPRWRQRERALEACRFLEALSPRGRLDLTAAVASFLSHPLLPGTVLILSDFYYPPEESLRALAWLAARRLTVVALHLLPSSHLSPPVPNGVLTVRDAETGEERTLQWDAASRTAYQQALERHLAALRAGCHERGFYYARLDPEAGLETCVLGSLVQAGVLG
ncbi:MAG: DUF58 domain-containing protein [Candidatus Binatia bacterium]|nr:DUF58 domain-containing protein [Candidatus Binatia bacterium]